MCLYLNKLGLLPRIALRNIKCYKVLNETKHSKLTFYNTPYQGTTIEIGNTYTSALKKYGNNIGEGLHSFKSTERINIVTMDCRHPVIVECIIPRWSIYYKGDYYGRVSYASNKLTYLKIIG